MFLVFEGQHTSPDLYFTEGGKDCKHVNMQKKLSSIVECALQANP